MCFYFLTYETEFVLFLAVLDHGLGQLIRDVKSDVRTLNFRSDVIFTPSRKTPNNVRKRSSCDVKCRIDVDARSLRRIDVDTTSIFRQVPAGST